MAVADQAVAPNPQLEQVRQMASDRGVEFFLAQFVNMHARSCAKLVPARCLDDLVSEGAGFAGFAVGEIGQDPSDPDLEAMPDLASYTPVPWDDSLAWLACDLQVEGKPWPYDPRTILRNQLDVAAAKGFDFRVGLELEYFLLRDDPERGLQLADPLDRGDKPCYDVKGLTRSYDFLRTVSTYVNELGWGNYANDHEDANGQFEQNFRFSDALTTCDRAVFFRYMVETLAQQRGLIATFMPKPFSHLTGNGAHFNMSLWDGERNLFCDGDDPRGLGLSKLAYQFIAGLKAHARAFIAVTAPTVNSYKRLCVGAPDSGATWSPTFVSYGGNNRSQMLRVTPGKVEDRTSDGACNPYLAATVLLAAGLDGIERGLDPGDPNAGNLYTATDRQLKELGIELLPTNLLDATRELAADSIIRRALGHARDEDYVDYFVAVKADEFKRYHEHVTPWEINQYLSRA